MINDPDLLILDEPTSGLDPIGCKEIKDLVSLLRDRGKTVIVCSHLLSDVEDICDRVIILYGGKIRAEGTLNDLLTVSESNTITTPALEPKQMEKVIATLRSLLKGEEFKVEHPKRTLEEFFLDVVEKARSENVETAGVLSGGKIAEYLEGGDDAAKMEKLLDELAAPGKSEGKAAPPPPDREERKKAEKAERALKKLTEKKEAPEEEKPTPAEIDKAEMEKANKKLEKLLEKK
jgi:ABC-2 type transport system ATP-binding protein